jgi:hypothetical protein
MTHLSPFPVSNKDYLPSPDQVRLRQAECYILTHNFHNHSEAVDPRTKGEMNSRNPSDCTLFPGVENGGKKPRYLYIGIA